MTPFRRWVACSHCGARIPLRSFRPPPRRCSKCGGLRDPEASRENLGCLIFFPIMILVGVAFGYAGFVVGTLFAPAINIPAFPMRLAFIAGFDGVGLVSLLAWRFIGGRKARSVLAPPAVFAMFFVVGGKCAADLGLRSVFALGLANGVCGSAMAWALLLWSKPPAGEDE